MTSATRRPPQEIDPLTQRHGPAMSFQSIFADHHLKVYPYRYRVKLHVGTLVGGTPSDPDVAESWLRTKTGVDSDELIRKAVLDTMDERQVDQETATAVVAKLRYLNGFRRDEHGLYIRGHQVKAMIKEASNIRYPWPQYKWGSTGKSTMPYIAEHIIVYQDKIHVCDRQGNRLSTHTDIQQRFVRTWRATGITYEEFVSDAFLNFLIISDVDFDKPIKMYGGGRDALSAMSIAELEKEAENDNIDLSQAGNKAAKIKAIREARGEGDGKAAGLNMVTDFWPSVWVTAEMQGIGATRSQGYGRFETLAFDREKRR